MNNTTQPDALRAKTIDAIMEQAQVFASGWSAVDGPFDNGHMLDDANEAKDELRSMVTAALQAAPPAPAALAVPAGQYLPLPEPTAFLLCKGSEVTARAWNADQMRAYVDANRVALAAAPAQAAPESHTQALEAIASWPVTDMLMNMDAANMRGIAQRALAAPAQEHATQLAEESEAADNWRRLALQFDNHRMQALWHLKAVLLSPSRHRHAAAAFLAEPPLDGEKVLADRIAQIAAAPAQAQEDAARLDAMQAQRIAVVPEFEGPWDATIYGDSDEPIISASGNTPREAIDAARAAQRGAA